MKKLSIIATVFTLSFLMFSCTNKDGARDALLDAGYHPIEVGGYAWFGECKDGFYQTNFKAYNPDCTRVVEGYVCQGLLSGKSVNLY